MPKFPKELQPKTITIVGVERICSGGRPLLPGESEYVEVVYAGIVGPSATLLYRRFLRELAATGGVVELATDELAKGLGVPRRSVLETLTRMHDFSVARWTGSHLEVPVLLPAFRPGIVQRLSTSAALCHLRTLESLEVRA